jgi:hypothetical protein
MPLIAGVSITSIVHLTERLMPGRALFARCTSQSRGMIQIAHCLIK